MYKWNNERLKRRYERIIWDAKQNNPYSFTDEELKYPWLNSNIFKTKSARIWRMITLAFTLGQMAGVKRVDEGMTPISLEPLEIPKNRYEIISLFAVKNDKCKYGDIFNNHMEAAKKYPKNEIIAGFGIKNLKTGTLAENSADIYFTYKEATEDMDKLMKGM